MISPETIARIKELMDEASVYEEDLDESFILGGGPGGQKTNKTSNVVRLSHEPSGLMVRCGRTLAEMILAREQGRKTAAQQAREKVRRQKRRRSRRQKQRMLDDKHAHSQKKAARRKDSFLL